MSPGRPSSSTAACRSPDLRALAAARRARRPRSQLGLVDHSARRRAVLAPKVDYVPPAAPGDQRRDTDRPLLTADPVDQPRVGHVPVADAVVADTGIDPVR